MYAMVSVDQNSAHEERGASRRKFLKTASVASAGALFAAGFGSSIIAAEKVHLLEHQVGQQMAEFILAVLGKTGARRDMANFLETAYLARANYSLPGDVSAFHQEFAHRYIIIGGRRDVRTASGVFLTANSWVFYDSESPRPFKDVNAHEMRCSLNPAIVYRYEGIPFPCGPREPFRGDHRINEAYQRTLDFYDRYHNSLSGDDKLNLSTCELEYVRPAQSAARFRDRRPSITTFGVVDKTKDPIQRAQLFGPEAA